MNTVPGSTFQVSGTSVSRSKDRDDQREGEVRMGKASPYSPDVFQVGKCQHEDCVATVYRAEGGKYAYCTSMHRHFWSGGMWRAAMGER